MKLVREKLYERFRETSDPVKDMEIGSIQVIRQWFLDNGFSEWFIKSIKLNDDNEIDYDGTVTFEDISNFPTYITFGSIGRDFYVKNSPNFTSLEGIPTNIKGDFIFFENGINPSEEEIREICEVGGYVMFTTKDRFIKQKRKEKYKRLGSISSRPSPRVNYTERHVEQEYSRGYMLWKLLEYIESERAYDGARYSDIVKFYYTTFMGQSYRRSLSTGVFNSLKRYIDQNKRKETGKYFLNPQGISYLKMYKDTFKGK